jgi:hypothetical protein
MKGQKTGRQINVEVRMKERKQDNRTKLTEVWEIGRTEGKRQA